MNSKLSKKSTYVMPTSKDNGREGLIQSVSPESQQEEKLPPLNSQELKALKHRVKEARERGLAPSQSCCLGTIKIFPTGEMGQKTMEKKHMKTGRTGGSGQIGAYLF